MVRFRRSFCETWRYPERVTIVDLNNGSGSSVSV